jgi:hypothetical protein
MIGDPTSGMKMASSLAASLTSWATYWGCSGDQRRKRVLDRPHQRVLNWYSPTDLLASDVDLDHRHVAGIEVPVREIGTEDEQGIAAFHRAVAGGEAKQASEAHVEGVVVLDVLLAAQGMHDRSL